MRYLILFLVLIASALGDQLEPAESEAIQAACDKMTSAYLENRHEDVAGMLCPELVKQYGGKERLVALLRAEERKNRDANIVIHSLNLHPRSDFSEGSRHRIVFVDSILIAESEWIKMRSISFQIAFRELNSSKWYLLDGTQMSLAQFRSIFRGVPADLELPEIRKERL